MRIRALFTNARRMAPEQSADEAEWIELLAAQQGPLRRFVLGIARSPDEADDVVQDTLIAAWEARHKVRDRVALRSWLFTTAKRLCRRRQWRRRLFVIFDPREEEHLHPSVEPRHGGDAELLYQALDKLPRVQREAVVLFELSECSIEEVAAIQSCPIPTAKSRIQRGRAKLTELLCGESQAEETSRR